MGEPRGRLEQLIAELEVKREEALRALEEYEVLLPHLQQGLQKLNEAGFEESGDGKGKAAPAPRPAPAPKAVREEAAEEPEAEAAEAETEAAEAEEAAPAEEPKEKKKGEPARRSIASLVAEDNEDEKKAASA